MFDIFLMNWYGKLYIFGKPISLLLTACNFLNIGDIWGFKKEYEALDEYILIMPTNVTYRTDAYVKTCRL